MKKLFLILLLVAMASGCTPKFTHVSFNSEADKRGISVLVIKADGSYLTTETKQKAGGLSEAVEAAKGLIDVAKEKVSESDITDIPVDDEEDIGAAVSPAGDVEETD